MKETIVPEDVTQLFEELTLQLIGRGFNHYSADAILHRIRWHHHVEQSDPTFKANNNWTATLAREFHERFPEHEGFFTTRCAPFSLEVFKVGKEADPVEATLETPITRDTLFQTMGRN